MAKFKPKKIKRPAVSAPLKSWQDYEVKVKAEQARKAKYLNDNKAKKALQDRIKKAMQKSM